MTKDKKRIVFGAIILILVVIATVSASYAYFVVATKTTGNDKNLNIVTENLGNIKWAGTKVFTSGDLLPGECGIQTFTIEKNSATGKGIYEIDLKGIIDEVFGSDVEITLYKSTDTANNNVTIKEGESTISGETIKQYYKEDSVVLNGTPEKVYGTKALQNKDKIILEQADFDNSNLQKTTYYLVYCYKNNGIQDNQQGKSFSGEISVKLIFEKSVQCELDSDTLACSILAQANEDSNLVYDETSDNNLRYIGANPDNYVIVDGELWRIIGVMNNIDDGTGKKESRIKLIRNESIGEYPWDTSDSSVNSGYGVNEWSGADLMKLLNPGYENESVGGSLYWSNKFGTCYNGQNNATTSCNFTNTGIKDELKSLIGNTIWNTGSNGTNLWQSTSGGLAKHFYIYERSDNTGKICSSGDYCNDDLERTTTWKGLVGLMYSSDYGYATSGGSATDRTTCLNTYLNDWNNSGVSDCKNNDWLFNSSNQWTLSPYVNSYDADAAFFVYYDGSVNATNGYYRIGIRPTVYLSSNVRVQSGDGSSSNPYILSK